VFENHCSALYLLLYLMGKRTRVLLPQNHNMKLLFSASVRQALLLALLGTTGLLTTACGNRTEDRAAVDYTAADEVHS
jgi:hypothetical protein